MTNPVDQVEQDARAALASADAKVKADAAAAEQRLRAGVGREVSWLRMNRAPIILGVVLSAAIVALCVFLWRAL